MSPETVARLTLLAYALIAAAIIAAQIVRSGISPTAWFLYVICRTFCDGWMHWRANRRCPFPSTGGALIIANHRSPVDPPMIWTNHHLVRTGRGPLRIISFMMAREYYQKFGLMWLCKTLGAIPVSRDGRDTAPAKETLSRLKAGQLICVFPEGGINMGPGLLPFDSGVAWLAIRSRVPVYPLFIHDAPRSENLVVPFLRPARVRITYGEPIDLSPWYEDRSRGALEAATAVLRGRMLQLGGLEAATSEQVPRSV